MKYLISVDESTLEQNISLTHLEIEVGAIQKCSEARLKGLFKLFQLCDSKVVALNPFASIFEYVL